MREQMRFQIRGPLVLFASLGFGFQIKWGGLGCHWAFFSLLFFLKNFRSSWNEAKCIKERRLKLDYKATPCIFLDHGDEEFGISLVKFIQSRECPFMKIKHLVIPTTRAIRRCSY